MVLNQYSYLEKEQQELNIAEAKMEEKAKEVKDRFIQFLEVVTDEKADKKKIKKKVTNMIEMLKG